MSLRITVISMGFLSFSVSGASFDCTKASTEVEKAICGEEGLSELDSRLSFYYSSLRGALVKNASSELLSEQRVWLRERNRVCESAHNKELCLEEKYRERVDFLKAKYEGLLLPRKEDLDGICSEIADLDSAGRYEYGDKSGFYDDLPEFDINNDGINEIVERYVDGSMGVPGVEIKLEDGAKIQPKTVNYEWKTYWTFGLRSFAKNDRWYQLHSYDNNLVKPAYVSYMTPENKEYVVCEFENTEVESFLPNEHISESEEICHEVSVGGSSKVESIQLTEPPVMSRSELRTYGRRETGLERQGYVDYNNDGVLNFIAELYYASGAGRGCDFNYFDELSVDGKSFIESLDRSLLLEMQKVNLDERHPNCGSWINGQYKNQFFKFGGQVYFEYSTIRNRAVYKIEEDQIFEVCGVEKSYETTVKSIGVPNR